MHSELFNIRVYGLLINEQKELLLTDEIRFGKKITKFPGGGLEYGEGTVECLKREWKEETEQEIEVLEHFYTTDFFQPSVFHERQQVISIYYFVTAQSPLEAKIKVKQFDFTSFKEDEQIFRWQKLSGLNKDQLTMPIDKIVAEKLREKFASTA